MGTRDQAGAGRRSPAGRTSPGDAPGEVAGGLRVGFVPGVTPDKWRRAWRERHPRVPLELFPVEQSAARALLDTEPDTEPDTAADTVTEGAEGAERADMVLARLPVDLEHPVPLHRVVLYEELPVVVASRDHFVAAADEQDEIDLADLDGEQLVLPHPSGWAPSVEQLPFGPMSVAEAIEVAASGTGIVVVPMSLARLHHRKDVTYRVVAGLEPTQVALLWRRDADSPLHQEFVGVVRGRRPGSSR